MRAVLVDGKVQNSELVQRTVSSLQQQGVTGQSLLELTRVELTAAPCNIPLGPATLLEKKIQALKAQARGLLLNIFHCLKSCTFIKLYVSVPCRWHTRLGPQEKCVSLSFPLKRLCIPLGLNFDVNPVQV